jgi:site-specific recombinase XerD
VGGRTVCDLRSITAGDADDWWAWMLSKRTPKLSENTARKSVSIARQIMRAATRKKLIEEDPFAHLVGTVKPNRSRDQLRRTATHPGQRIASLGYC